MATCGSTTLNRPLAEHGSGRSPTDQRACELHGVVGFDIGGANLKLHCGDVSHAVPFAMWRTPERLAEMVADAIRGMPGASNAVAWAVTMTGEMADTFPDRPTGVRRIVEQVVAAASELRVPALGFYSVEGRFVDPREAITEPEQVASANWHALANWVCRSVDQDSLLVDVGSTTTDLIEISNREVRTASRTDHDRLKAGELVYVGLGRTPVCSLVRELPFRGQSIPVMREVFANTDDCAILMGWSLWPATSDDPEAPSHAETMTCDGGPRTRAAAHRRIARMIGLDQAQMTDAEATVIADAVFDAACDELASALTLRHTKPHTTWVVAGHGMPLVKRLAARMSAQPRLISLADLCGPAAARVAPAMAVAELWSQDCGGKALGSGS